MLIKIFALLLTMSLMKDSYWVTVSKGAALHLNPFTNNWEPISQKEQIRKHTFVLTKENSEIVVYENENTVTVSSNMYVYLNDLFIKNDTDLLSKITKIQMDQLPSSKNGTKNKKREIGLTFGEIKASKEAADILHLQERINAINHFDKSQLKRSSLLTLKRLMTKYPSLYLDYEYTKKLFDYYEEFNLKGVLFDESLALKQLNTDDKLKIFINDSHDKVKNELIRTEN